ncbi:MAG TPA: alkaline phosphatase family protein, partial [Rhizomicrobium sp.]|nr:alkaline phosphatase family protein [Rhizomicrobium sp.]
LCVPQSQCSTTDSTKYDIQVANWLTKGGSIDPTPVALANGYDLGHSHLDFVNMCDAQGGSFPACQMDGAASIPCKGTCPTDPQFKYVNNSTGILTPYLSMVTQYGWANLMFESNQGPSFPAHQFLFGATSAPNANDDQIGTFAAENYPVNSTGGCIAPQGTIVKLIDSSGNENQTTYPCFEHRTISDLLGSTQRWRYYATNVADMDVFFGDLWNAPLAISHICVPNQGNTACTGPLFQNNVDLNPADVLTDINSSTCALPNLIWVTPTGQSSDHPQYNDGSGPQWVANIVNAIGESSCNYWTNTAIVALWDDWGGWYDHEGPSFLPPPYSAYQYGFRVPMIFISAYTPQGYIDKHRSDFGTIARFVEYNFGIAIGALGFTDNRGDLTQRLQGFYNLQMSPRPFVPIPTARDAASFINDKSRPLPPDND